MRRVSARISDEAKRGWDRFLESHGVTFTAMVEASGLLLDESRGELLSDNETVVDLARRIDRERAERS